MMGRHAIRILTGRHARSHHSISTRSSWGSAAASCGSLLGLAYLSLLSLDSSVTQNESKTTLLKKPENDHHNLLYRKYHVEHVIGSGGFANVCAGREKLSDSPVAIKCMPKRLTPKAKFEKEVSILKQLKGKDHVVQLKEAFETRDDWVLVMDLVPGGELFDRLISKGTYAENQAKRLAREISQALKQLHAHHVVHADVKPENILLESSKESAHLILIDFGLSFHDSSEEATSLNATPTTAAAHHHNATTYYSWDGSGTLAYAAPEVLSKSCGDNITCAIDMWALGIVLYVVLVGHHPFDPTSSLSDLEMRERILDGAFDYSHEHWSRLSTEAKHLIQCLLRVDPAARYTAAQVLNHPWLR